MIDFLLSVLTYFGLGLACMYAGAYFHGPVLNGAGYVADWVKARFEKKP